jgi:hypothetical protein
VARVENQLRGFLLGMRASFLMIATGRSGEL